MGLCREEATKEGLISSLQHVEEPHTGRSVTVLRLENTPFPKAASACGSQATLEQGSDCTFQADAGLASLICSEDGF